MIIKKIFIFSAILVLLTACGRSSKPEQLEPNGYPRTYPSPLVETFGAGKSINESFNSQTSNVDPSLKPL